MEGSVKLKYFVLRCVIFASVGFQQKCWKKSTLRTTGVKRIICLFKQQIKPFDDAHNQYPKTRSKFFFVLELPDFLFEQKF